MKHRLFILSIMILLTTSACSRATLVPDRSGGVTQTAGSVPTLTQEAEANFFNLEVTPDPSAGAVTGMIHYKNAPLQSYPFYLADVLKDPDSGVEISTALDRNNAPRALSDQEGRFTFMNVPPGRYGLILLDGMDTFLLLYPKDGTAILMTVEAGKTIDLGTIEYSDLPIDK